MAKTILFQVLPGAVDGTTAHTVTPGGGGNSFVVDDLSAPKTIKVQGLAADDAINIQMQDYAGTAYDSWGSQLNTRRTTATPMEIGTFALMGSIKGDPADPRGIILYVEDAS